MLPVWTDGFYTRPLQLNFIRIREMDKKISKTEYWSDSQLNFFYYLRLNIKPIPNWNSGILYHIR